MNQFLAGDAGSVGSLARGYLAGISSTPGNQGAGIGKTPRSGAETALKGERMHTVASDLPVAREGHPVTRGLLLTLGLLVNCFAKHLSG